MDRLPHALAARPVAEARFAHHLGEDHPDRKQIGPGVHRLAPALLRRHVGRSPRHRPASRLRLQGNAEVHDHHAARAGDHHVLGLEVPVHEPRRVHRVEPGEELQRQVPGLAQRKGAALLEKGQERLAVDVLHRQELPPVHLNQVEDPAHVRGDDLPSGAHLLAEKLAARLVLVERRVQRLQGHVDAQLQVEGLPHLAHPAPSEEPLDPVPR